MDNYQQSLNTSLQKNFANQTEKHKGWRNGVRMESSTDIQPDYEVTDRWIADTIRTGGQEILSVNGIPKLARVYLGGVIPEALSKLGLTEGEVMTYLASIVDKYGQLIRLNINVRTSSEDENDMFYSDALVISAARAGEIKFREGEVLQNDPNFSDDWNYNYSVVSRNPHIPIISGEETITYKGNVVFVHQISFMPIEG